MLVRCLRASLLFVLLLFPALTFQSDLSGPNIVPIRTRETPRENRPGGTNFPEPTLRVDSSLVLIPAQVTTREGAPIMDLKRKDFRIYEDGTEQEITYFARDDAPVSVGLLLDSSGSMRNKSRSHPRLPRRSSRPPIRMTSFFWSNSTTTLSWPFPSPGIPMCSIVKSLMPGPSARQLYSTRFTWRWV